MKLPKILIFFFAVLIVIVFLNRSKFSSPLIQSGNVSEESKKEPPATLNKDWKDYDSSFGFSIKYPPTWKADNPEEIKPTDTKYKSLRRNDKGTVQISKIKKDDTGELRIEAQKDFDKDKCPYTGPVELSKSNNKFLTILGKASVRNDILSQALPYTFGQEGGAHLLALYYQDESKPSSFKTCYENPDKHVRLVVYYYSKNFTNSNITQKKIDTTLLNELDNIAQTISLK